MRLPIDALSILDAIRDRISTQAWHIRRPVSQSRKNQGQAVTLRHNLTSVCAISCVHGERPPNHSSWKAPGVQWTLSFRCNPRMWLSETICYFLHICALVLRVEHLTRTTLLVFISKELKRCLDMHHVLNDLFFQQNTPCNGNGVLWKSMQWIT